MNLSPDSENLFNISSILYLSNKKGPNKGILLETVFIPKLRNNPLASWYLINLNFLVSQIANLDKIVSFSLFVFATLGLLLSVFFSTPQTIK